MDAFTGRAKSTMEQMIAAQNELERRRPAPEITEEGDRGRVRKDREGLKRWRES